jgi:predicted secreted protein
MDKRGSRVVYVSRCLLDQNLRFPGIAVRAGAFAEVLALFLRNDIGIEQLPCLEVLGWGGVSRTHYFRLQPLVFRAVDSRWQGLAQALTRIWLFDYRRLCRRSAKRVADEIEDFNRAGCSVLGIVAMNDSPTCGVTRTIDLTKAARTLKGLGVEAADFESPNLERMREIIPRLCTSGQGLFMGEVIRQVERRGLAVKVIGFDPWGDPSAESERVAESLDLKL